MKRMIVVLTGLVLGAGLAGPGFAAGDSVSYAYDSLGRLTQLTYANGTIVTYAYDGAGNRTTVAVTCGSNGC